MELAESIHSR